MAWDQNHYRRHLVDMHISDWDDRMLSNFNAEKYIELVKHSGQQSIMHYANSHSGQCCWDTKVGPKHKIMAKLDRDFFQEVADACEKQDIELRAYFSLMWDSWNYEHHPDWRLVPPGKIEDYQKARYGHVCPNAPGYRDYVASCIKELLTQYPTIQDIFFDMIFWPTLCYCEHCQERFKQETGIDELPTQINWSDPNWRAFQAARQRWLLDFAKFVYQTVKGIRPEVTVSYNNASFLGNWTAGMPFEIVETCDYLFGDFYGGPIQHSLACMIYHSLRPDRPFEYATFVTENFYEHVSTKTPAEVTTEWVRGYAHGGAVMQINGFDVDGQLHAPVYHQLKDINAIRPAIEPYLGGQLIADVAIYVDKESMYDPPIRSNMGAAEGTVGTQALQEPHLAAVTGTSRALQSHHIPFGLVTNANLDRINEYKVIILPSVLELTETQADQLKKYVLSGGTLYLSGPSALDRVHGKEPKLLLEDVLGIKHIGILGTSVTYLTPTNNQNELIQAIAPQKHLTVYGAMEKVECIADDVEVLAEVTLPFAVPKEGCMIGQTFASIHTNPPALEPTSSPALIRRKYGKGTVIWSASTYESNDQWSNHALLARLVEQHTEGAPLLKAEASPQIEMTIFHNSEKNQLRCSLLDMDGKGNRHDAKLTVRLPNGLVPSRVRQIPNDLGVEYISQGNQLTFELQDFVGYTFVIIE